MAYEKRNTLIENCGFCNSKILSSLDFFHYLLKIQRKSFWFSVMGMIDFAFLRSIKLKFLDGIIHEDHYFGKVLFYKVKKIFILVDKVYHYRIRAKSIMDYSSCNDDIPEFMHDTYLFFHDKTIFKKYLRNYSLFVTASMIFLFLKQSDNSEKKSLFEKIFREKLFLWQKDFLCNFSVDEFYFLFNTKILYGVDYSSKILFESIYDFIQYQNMQIDIITKKSVKNEYKIKNHLSYKIGHAMVKNCKNWHKGGIFKLPYDIYKIYINHRKKNK
ncbi:hypothetical protein CK567_07600 [Campylobacter lari]|nr:hypothetical protein [Campylobacter lari]EAJ5701976.1 hypothetical protein [Campylobacter lari]MCR2078048.1 hypothetical protein [Campylobacter lari subsp. concheus]MCR2087328.1 hypothetical protein [Campylobacter lari subsp. concheus]